MLRSLCEGADAAQAILRDELAALSRRVDGLDGALDAQAALRNAFTRLERKFELDVQHRDKLLATLVERMALGSGEQAAAAHV